MNNTAAHQALVDQVLLEIGSSPYCRCWKNATGTARSFDGKRVIAFGLPGASDILGILANGKMLCLEIKTGNGVQSEKQKNFEAMIKKFGGIYAVIRAKGQALQLVKTELGLFE